MSAEERAERGTRDRSRPLPAGFVAKWEAWGAELAREGLRLIREAKKFEGTKSALDIRAQGLLLLERAERFLSLVARHPSSAPKTSPAAGPASSLDAFRRRRQS